MKSEYEVRGVHEGRPFCAWVVALRRSAAEAKVRADRPGCIIHWCGAAVTM